MRVEEYFTELQQIIDRFSFRAATETTFDQRSTYQGFFRGIIFLTDESVLHVREYVDTENGIDRFVYAYQYMDPDQRLVFRYDNAPHHSRLGLASFPHYKHDGSETNIVASSAPTLAEVLNEIENRMGELQRSW